MKGLHRVVSRWRKLCDEDTAAIPAAQHYAFLTFHSSNFFAKMWPTALGVGNSGKRNGESWDVKRGIQPGNAFRAWQKLSKECPAGMVNRGTEIGESLVFLAPRAW
jgi:hypothetical protein